MSTEYKVFEREADNGDVHSLELHEHSSLLDMWTFMSRDKKYLSESLIFKDFTPEQIVCVSLQMLKIASYQIDVKDFNEAVENAANKDKSGVGYVLDRLRQRGRIHEQSSKRRV